MAKLSIAERIAQLETRKRVLKARLTKHDRARDTRRKVLLGALLLQQLEASRDPDFKRRLTDWLKNELPGFLTRDEDRKLFPEFIAQASGGSGAGTRSAAVSDEEGREERDGDDNGGGEGEGEGDGPLAS